MKFQLPSLLLLACLGAERAVVRVVAADGECFADREELKYAIDVCFAGGVGGRAYQTSTAANATLCEGVQTARGWPVNAWCVGAVTDMRYLFVQKADFDEDLRDWDTAAVTDFFEMFSYASSFDGDVSAWDTGRVANASGMFYEAAAFDGDLSAWDTSRLTNMKVRTFETRGLPRS